VNLVLMPSALNTVLDISVCVSFLNAVKC